jgi:hypothetical protein
MAGLALLQACGEPQVAQLVHVNKYFDLESYLKNQADYLSEASVVVNKQLRLNGEQENQRLQKVDWDKEFAFFKEADINKSAWRNSFSVDSLVDSTAGKRSVVYTSIDESINVEWLKLNYDPGKRLTSIEARVAGKNMLYSTGRYMFIDCFYDKSDSLRIKSYMLNGYQKLILQDSVNYNIKAEIEYIP